jgi:hypothetical protein
MNALAQELRIVPGKALIMDSINSYSKSTATESETKLYTQVSCLKAILGLKHNAPCLTQEVEKYNQGEVVELEKFGRVASWFGPLNKTKGLKNTFLDTVRE